MQDAPPILFLEAPKRECAAPGGREKTLRRVGLRQRRPPAAGGGWLAVPRGGQGRKRPALGETFGPGKSGIPAAPIFAAAGRLLMKATAWANATAPTPARAARSEAERAERGAVQMRPCTPTRLEPPPRDGSADFAEENSVPEGQPKSEQAPIRRPPSRAEGHCTGARLAAFSFGPCTARFLFHKMEKKMGGASPLDKPPAGADTPPGRRDGGPSHPLLRQAHLPLRLPRPVGRPSLPLRQGKFF